MERSAGAVPKVSDAPESAVDPHSTNDANSLEPARGDDAGAKASSFSSRVAPPVGPTSVGLLGVRGVSKTRPKTKSGTVKARPRSRPTKAKPTTKPKAKQKKGGGSGGRGKKAAKKGSGSVSVADV